MAGADLRPAVVERVACFAVAPRQPGGSVAVRAGDLLDAIRVLPLTTTIVVVLDGHGDDDGTDRTPPVGEMVEAVEALGIDGIVRHIEATQALKRIDRDLVVESLDRARFSTPGPPEVLNRLALERALAAAEPVALVNPAQAVANDGGIVRVFGAS